MSKWDKVGSAGDVNNLGSVEEVAKLAVVKAKLRGWKIRASSLRVRMNDPEEKKKTGGFLAGQQCCGDNDSWSFFNTYKEMLKKPQFFWDLNKLVSYQNIIAEGGGRVKDNILKRQETYGVAFALLLGCAIGVLAAVANRQGPNDVCNKGGVPIEEGGPGGYEHTRSECYAQQIGVGVAIGFSILIEMLVLNNIAFVSTCASMHIAHTLHDYQWMFVLPVNFGIPLVLIPLTFSVAMSISVNMTHSSWSWEYPPSMIVYVLLAFTFLFMWLQSFMLTQSKFNRILDEAKVHFPDVEFSESWFVEATEKSEDEQALLDTVEEENLAMEPESAREDEVNKTERTEASEP